MSAKGSGRWLWLICLGMSCAVGPRYERPAPPKVEGYTREPAKQTNLAEGQAQRFEASNALAPDWWRLFHCAALDGVVSDALAGNASLEASEAALRRSQDALRAGYGVFFPQADASGGASKQRANGARLGNAAVVNPFNLFTLSASVSYALDVWGGQRRAIEALKADVEAQRSTVIGASVMLSGNVVNTVIATAAYRAEVEATSELIAVEQDQVRLSEAQARAGTLPYANLLALSSQVASTRATLPGLEEKIEQGQHLLATLSGRLPGAWSPPVIALGDLTLPGDVPVSLPAALVRQRPDILIAEAELHASNARIGVATAAMLPNFTLNASYGLASTKAADLTAGSSRVWGLGAGLTQPLFHGGTLYYGRREAIDARDQAAATYRQTVLTAFAQVADSLRALEHDADALAAQAEALHDAEDAFKLVKIDYQSGLANYLQVLTANGQYLQSRIGYIQAEAQRLQDTVALFVALGGGWWNGPAHEGGSSPGAGLRRAAPPP
jgi:NodT family efflux transporter outer membrane factor (OMF) lipoprotein